MLFRIFWRGWRDGNGWRRRVARRRGDGVRRAGEEGDEEGGEEDREALMVYKRRISEKPANAYIMLLSCIACIISRFTVIVSQPHQFRDRNLAAVTKPVTIMAQVEDAYEYTLISTLSTCYPSQSQRYTNAVTTK
jgi:hypothetical protein